MSSRQAALLVHSLAAADREWMLSRLNMLEQERLRGLLSELGELGIPQDRRLVESALAQAAPQAPAAAPVPTDDDGLVKHAGAEAIAQALQGEPPAFVHKLIACGDWPWQEAVASRLGISASPDTAQQGTAAAPAWRHAAIRLLASRLRDAGAAAQAPASPANTPAVAAASKPWVKPMPSMWRKPQ